MAAKSAWYRCRANTSVNSPGNPPSVYERSSTGYTWGAMDFARDALDLSPTLDNGHVSQPVFQAAVAILADALAADIAGRDAAGDARAKVGYQRFAEHFLSRLPRGANCEFGRTLVMQVVENLGI